MIRGSVLIALLIAFGKLAAADTPPIRDATRGELLYSVHCLACHNAEVHWRDKKQVINWASLKSEVRRWAAASELRWSDDDIAEVARYVNALHYHYTVQN